MPLGRRSWDDPVARGRLVAVVILSAGWLAAGAAWVTAVPVMENDDVYDMRHSRKYDLAVQRLGGKATLLAVEIDDWLAALWSGRTRAYTLFFASTALAGAAILVRRAGWPEAEDPGPGTRPASSQGGPDQGL